MHWGSLGGDKQVVDGLPSWAPSIIAVAVALSLGPEPPDSLENKMRRSVFAVVLSTTVAAPALAGTVITSEVSAPNVAGHSIVYYIEPDRVRMEYPGHIVIFRGDQDAEYMLAPTEKKFRRMTPETMKQSAAAATKMFELLRSMSPEQRAQLEKRMPPEQRAQFEKIMTPEGLAQGEKIMTGQTPKSEYRKSGGTASFGKWRCERVEVVKDGKPRSTLCVAAISDLGLTEDDLSGLRRAAAFMEPIAGAVADPIDGLHSIEEVVGYVAYPVHVEIPAVEMQTTIKTVETKPLAADLFEVPADYREESVPAPR